MTPIRSDFNLKEYLEEAQKQIDAALESFIPKADGKFKTLHEAMRYSVFAGGKRLRPILCKASFEIFKKDLETLLPVACALELIHTYSLVHDDLPCMDNDDFRRGKPTNHKVFGEGIAVLAGDALLTLAFELVARTPHISSSTVIVALQELTHVSGTFGLIGGQVEDLESEGKTISSEQLQLIHEHKTAALFQASISLGGVVAEATKEEVDRLRQFGKKVGLAFQIVDDILDVESSTSQLGKTAHKDAEQKKATYPSLYGLEESKKMAAQLKNEAIEILKPFGDRADALVSLASFVIERKN